MDKPPNGPKRAGRPRKNAEPLRSTSIRLSPTVEAQLREAAEKNGRGLSGEIEARLKDSIEGLVITDLPIGTKMFLEEYSRIRNTTSVESAKLWIMIKAGPENLAEMDQQDFADYIGKKAAISVVHQIKSLFQNAYFKEFVATTTNEALDMRRAGKKSQLIDPTNISKIARLLAWLAGDDDTSPAYQEAALNEFSEMLGRKVGSDEPVDEIDKEIIESLIISQVTAQEYWISRLHILAMQTRPRSRMKASSVPRTVRRRAS